MAAFTEKSGREQFEVEEIINSVLGVLNLKCMLDMKSVYWGGSWMYRFGASRTEPRVGNKNLGVLCV